MLRNLNIQYLRRLWREIDLRYIYAMYSRAFVLRVKIGISEAPRRRAKEIAGELSAAKGRKVGVRLAIWLPLLFSRTTEQTIHRRLAFFSANMPDHNGSSEWFWMVNLVASVIVCAVAFFCLGCRIDNFWNDGQVWFSTCFALAFLSAFFYPADAALIVIAVFLWEVRWIAAAVTAGVIWFT